MGAVGLPRGDLVDVGTGMDHSTAYIARTGFHATAGCRALTDRAQVLFDFVIVAKLCFPLSLH